MRLSGKSIIGLTVFSGLILASQIALGHGEKELRQLDEKYIRGSLRSDREVSKYVPIEQQAHLNILELQNKTLLQAVLDLRAKVRELDNRLHQDKQSQYDFSNLQQERDELARQNETLSLMLEEQKASAVSPNDSPLLTSLQEENNSLKESIARLEGKLKSASERQQSLSEGEGQLEIEHLKSKIALLEEKLALATDELSKKLRSSSSSDVLEKQSEQLAMMEREVDRLTDEKFELSKKLETVMRNASLLESSLEEKSREIELASKDESTLKTELTKSKDLVQRSENVITKLVQKNKSLEKELETSKASIQTAEGEAIAKDGELELLRSTIKAQEEAIREMKATLLTTGERATDVLAESSSKDAEILELKSSIESQKKEYARARKIITKLESTLGDVTSKLKSNGSDLQSTSAKVGELQVALKEKDDELKAKVSELKNEMEKVEKLSTGTERAIAKIRQVTRKNKDLEAENALLSKALEEKSTRLAEATETFEKFPKVKELLRTVAEERESCLGELEENKQKAKLAEQYEIELVEAKNKLLLRETEIKALGGDPKALESLAAPAAERLVDYGTRASHTAQPSAPMPESADVLIVEITAAKANLRSGPGLEHSPIMQVGRGTRLTVESRRGEWYRVITPTGTRAYVQTDVVSDGSRKHPASISQGRSKARIDTPQPRKVLPSGRVERKKKQEVETLTLRERLFGKKTDSAGRKLVPVKNGRNGSSAAEDAAFEELRRGLLSR